MIQWWKSLILSNSLVAVYGLTKAGIDRQMLGLDVEFDVEPMGKTNTEINVDPIAARIEAVDLGM